MANNWSEAQISAIVNSVLKQIKTADPACSEWNATSYCGRKFVGIYADMNDAIAAADKGYRVIRNMSVTEREKLITVIRQMIHEEAAIMGALGVAETHMGRADHKTAKHHLVADKTPGTEDIEPTVKTGDNGLTLTEMAPFGVVGSITPSTNPSETVLCNSIGMIGRQRCGLQSAPQCHRNLQLCGRPDQPRQR